jgi:hypothetical protein
MPIVSHTLQTSVQANGSTQNILRLYDQDGREYMLAFPAPAGFDLAARVQTAIAEMDVQLAEQEFEQLVGQE